MDIKTRPTAHLPAASERLFDVQIPLDQRTLAQARNPTAEAAHLSRQAADAFAAQHGLVLRHPDPREVHVTQGVNPLTGRAVVLVNTRWLADTR